MGRLGRNLLLAGAATLLALGGAEALVRLVLERPGPANLTPVPAEIQTEPRFPGVRYVLRPDAEVVHRFPSDPRGYFDPGATLTYRTNSLGFRGPETTRAKPPGVFRIVGLGDSFTFGTGVRREDTFLAVLEARLDAQHGPGAFEVLNLGVMGYQTANEVALLRFRGLALDPDLVVLCFFPNDAHETATHQLFNVGPAAERPWWRHSALIDRIAWWLERRRQAAAVVEVYRNAFRRRAPGWRQARRALRQARELSELHEFQLVLAIFPVLWRLSDDHPFAEIHATVADFAQGLGIPVLDLLPAFEGYDGPELWVHPTNQHPNERGHAVAGEALHRFLVDEGLVGLPSG